MVQSIFWIFEKGCEAVWFSPEFVHRRNNVRRLIDLFPKSISESYGKLHCSLLGLSWHERSTADMAVCRFDEAVSRWPCFTPLVIWGVQACRLVGDKFGQLAFQLT